MEINSNLLILLFCIGVLSETITILTLYFQLTIRSLRKFPGILITLQCISQVFFDLHWFSLLPTIKSWLKSNSFDFCYYWGFVTMFFYFQGYNYSTCLAFEVILKVKNGANLSFKKRLIIYHLVSNLLSLIFCILILVDGGFGESAIGTCSVADKLITNCFEFTPFVLNIPIIWFSVIYALVHIENKYKSITINYVLIVASVSVTWFLPTFIKLISKFGLNNYDLTVFGIIIGTTSGFFVGLSRLLNKKVMKEIKSVLINNELKNFNLRKEKVETNPKMRKLIESMDSFSEDYDFFTNFFELISQNKISLILLALIIKTKKNLESETIEKHQKTIKFTQDDFDIVSVLATQENLKELHSKDFALKIYKSQTFSEIMKISQVSSEEIYSSISNLENFRKIKTMNSMQGGKSESFIFSTTDGKFILKTINRSEKITLCKTLLKKYLQRLKTCEKSRLVRIYGLFKLLPEQQYFMLMENIAPNSENALIFDLKGSYDNRYVETLSEAPTGVTLKDENFRKLKKKIKIKQVLLKDTLETLEGDMKMLMELNIMDYSLLTVFYNEDQLESDCNERYLLNGRQRLFAIGIIDILQKYNQSKRSERAIKRVMFRRTLRMSSIPSNQYYERIVSFLKEIFTCENPSKLGKNFTINNQNF